MKVQDEKIEVVPIDEIDDNPFQTRSHYGRKDLDELMASIGEHGLRQIPEARRVDGRVQLAYGHLRKRAIAKLCKKSPKKWPGMPLRVKELSDEDMFYFALEENMRRRDVTPIDVANSVDAFLTQFPEKTEVEVAKKLNMTQGNISNMRRVLRLPAKVLEKVEEGKINFTMGRELLILQGRTGRSMHTQQEMDDEFLMLAVIKNLVNENATYSYGNPRTVDGIKKSIFQVVRNHFPKLYNEGTTYGYSLDPLFDIEAAGCLKCQKMIRCHETKAQTRPFCTDRPCWEALRKKHQAQQAKETKRRMEADMRQRAEAMAVEQLAQSGDDDNDPVTEAYRERLEDEQQAVTQTISQEIPATQAKEAKPEKKPVPKELLKQAKEAAGTRAEVLDMEDIREGHWGLKKGYVQLNNELHHMDDPDECTKRCTKGFHYAFDSRHGAREGMIYQICSTPKCVGQKKAAFTRARNAEGAAKKKAELKAIREAVDATEWCDRTRMIVVIQASLEGTHVGDRYWGASNDWSAKKWWWKKVMDQDYKQGAKLQDLYARLVPMTEEKLAQLLVEFSLSALQYKGDLLHYKVQTTEALNRLGVGVTMTPEMRAQIGDVEGDQQLVTNL